MKGRRGRGKEKGVRGEDTQSVPYFGCMLLATLTCILLMTCHFLTLCKDSLHYLSVYFGINFVKCLFSMKPPDTASW